MSISGVNIMAKNDSDIVPFKSDDIAERLDTIIRLLIPSMATYPEETNDLHREILKLCDSEHTTEDIRKSIGKSANHVNKELSILRSRGLIGTVLRNGEKVHIRLPVN